MSFVGQVSTRSATIRYGLSYRQELTRSKWARFAEARNVRAAQSQKYQIRATHN